MAVPAVPRWLHPLDLLHACCFTGAIFHSFAVNIGELGCSSAVPSITASFLAQPFCLESCLGSVRTMAEWLVSQAMVRCHPHQLSEVRCLIWWFLMLDGMQHANSTFYTVFFFILTSISHWMFVSCSMPPNPSDIISLHPLELDWFLMALIWWCLHILVYRILPIISSTKDVSFIIDHYCLLNLRFSCGVGEAVLSCWHFTDKIPLPRWSRQLNLPSFLVEALQWSYITQFSDGSAYKYYRLFLYSDTDIDYISI